MQKKLVAFSLSLFTLIPKPSSTTYASGSLTTPLILPESCSNSSHSPGNDTDFDLALSALRVLFNEEEREKSISKAGQKKPSQWLKDRPELLEKWKKIYERNEMKDPESLKYHSGKDLIPSPLPELKSDITKINPQKVTPMLKMLDSKMYKANFIYNYTGNSNPLLGWIQENNDYINGIQHESLLSPKYVVDVISKLLKNLPDLQQNDRLKEKLRNKDYSIETLYILLDNIINILDEYDVY